MIFEKGVIAQSVQTVGRYPWKKFTSSGKYRYARQLSCYWVATIIGKIRERCRFAAYLTSHQPPWMNTTNWWHWGYPGQYVPWCCFVRGTNQTRLRASRNRSCNTMVSCNGSWFVALLFDIVIGWIPKVVCAPDITTYQHSRRDITGESHCYNARYFGKNVLLGEGGHRAQRPNG